MDKQYVWRSWVRWSIKIIVTIVSLYLIWVGMQKVMFETKKSSGYEVLMARPSQPTVEIPYSGGSLYNLGYEVGRGWHQAALDVWDKAEAQEARDVPNVVD